MAKPEWGRKHVCPGCGTRFYDLGRDPIVCPGCGATFDPLAGLRPRRGRTAAAAREIKPPAVVAEGDDDESVIEDAAELDEVDNDVSDVTETKDVDVGDEDP